MTGHDARQLGLHGTAPTFNLMTQPWIPVTHRDGAQDETSLARLLLGAHRIRRIAGETPPMTAALTRLVLALMHRVYGPASIAEWGRLWKADRLPSAPLAQYLQQHQEQFDLFHPERPFLQCPALSSVTPATPAKLVPYRAVGNNVTLFDHTTANDRVLLTPAEAARWLVTTQSFDPGGMKTPYLKDKSSERAPCNAFGVVVVEGATLKQTLLLNTLVYRPKDGRPAMTAERDRPAWEASTPPRPEPDKRVAYGWTDLLTWPSRRILLSTTTTDGRTSVDGVVLTPGTRLTVAMPDEEMMAAFRRPVDARGRPKSDAPLLPVRLHPVRGVWRHSVELLLDDHRNEGRSRQRPRILDQIPELVAAGLLPEETVITLRVFGQQLDSNYSVVEICLEEELPAPVALLRAKDRRLGSMVGWAIGLADDAGAALRRMEREYRKELRAEPTSALDLDYWPRLARPFGVFLISIAAAHRDSRPETPATGFWAREVARLANDSASRWANGPTMTRQLITVGKHYERFRKHMGVLIGTFHGNIANYATRDVS